MPEFRRIGRYELFAELASGGMATVHLARLLGGAGFARTVAIKRLHPNFSKDPEFVSMFLDEARLAARIRHPNVVPVLDVESLEGELFLVMEYVHGESLSKIMRLTQGEPLPAGIGARIAADVLYGLHAAHEAKSQRGEPLHIVHRDISPQNVLVGADGISRVTDFGVAKAVDRIQTTHEGQLKGKLSYMSPEQLDEKTVDRRSDVYAASVVLWEIVTGRRLHGNLDAGATVTRILHGKMPRPSDVVSSIPKELDEIVLRGLARNPDDRFATAREMAIALERVVRPEPSAEVAEWVQRVAAEVLDERARLMAELESASTEPAPTDQRARAVELAQTRARSIPDAEEPTAPSGIDEAVTRETNAPSAATDGESKSSITLERSLHPKPKTRFRAGIALAVGLMGIAGAAAALFALRSKTPATVVHSSESAASALSASPAVVEPPELTTTSAPLPIEPTPSASVSAQKSPAPKRAPPPKPAVAPPPPAKSTEKPKSAFGSLTRE